MSSSPPFPLPSRHICSSSRTREATSPPQIVYRPTSHRRDQNATPTAQSNTTRTQITSTVQRQQTVRNRRRVKLVMCSSLSRPCLRRRRTSSPNRWSRSTFNRLTNDCRQETPPLSRPRSCNQRKRSPLLSTSLPCRSHTPRTPLVADSSVKPLLQTASVDNSSSTASNANVTNPPDRLLTTASATAKANHANLR